MRFFFSNVQPRDVGLTHLYLSNGVARQLIRGGLGSWADVYLLSTPYSTHCGTIVHCVPGS